MHFSIGSRTLAHFLLIVSVTLVGCKSDSTTEAATPPAPGDPPTGNLAPVISGDPAPSVIANNAYSFTPIASDPDGDPLTYDIDNLPIWAAFDEGTGELAGIPDEGDVALYGDITISVSDGTDSAILAPFEVEVQTGVVAEPPPPPADGWPVGVPEPPFVYTQAPGAPTSSGELPSTLTAGEVHDFTGQTGEVDLTLSCSGTEADPAFIVGGTLTSADDDLRISGEWCIFVDTIFENTRLITSGNHHIFRNIEQRNTDSHNGMELGGTDIILIDSEVHHNQGDDRHGVHAAQGSSNIWLLRNHIHHNGGDGFQACHRCEANPPRNVYIAQNVIHSDRENAVDFKYIEDVVVSENIMYGYVSAPEGVPWCFDDGTGCGTYSSGSDGSAIVIGSDGGPTNVLVVNNEIYDSVNGIRIEKGILTSLVNNNIHDVDDMCLALEKEGQNIVYDGNSCNRAARGIFQFWRENFSLFITDSQFSNISGPAIEFESDQVGQNGTLELNEFDTTGPVIYSGTIADTEAEINNLPNATGNRVIQ